MENPKLLEIFNGRVLAAVCLFLWALVPSLVAQETKPDAAVAPVASLGDISTAQQRIVFNSLESLLTGSYQLVSQDDYAEAEERAFAELEADECTEEQCIRAIQDYLQVDRLFVLQIIREGDFSQLTLTLVRADDKLVKAETCEGCSISQLNDTVYTLFAAIVAIDLGGQAPASPAPPAPAAQARLAEAARQDELDAVLAPWRWKWGSALVGGLLLGAYGFTESQSLDDSNAKQNKLLADLGDGSDLTQAEFDAQTAAIKKEEAKADDHQQNALTGYLASAALLGLAAWIYFDPAPEVEAALVIVPLIRPQGGLGIALAARW